MQRMEAAIEEVEQKLAEGHLTEQEAAEAISTIRSTHERLNRLEAKLAAKQGPLNARTEAGS